MIKKYRVHVIGTNESQTKNILNQNFDYDEPMNTIVTNLTYVDIAGKWFFY